MKRRRFVLATALLAVLLCGCGASETPAPPPKDAKPENVSDNVPGKAADDGGDALPEPAEGLPDWARAYFAQVLAYESESPASEYALIDLIGGDIPALAAGRSGYDVSLYQYGGGVLHILMDRRAYGACGNHGYEYLPGQGVIRNYNTDLAGLVLYTSYDRVTEAWTLDSYTLALWNFDDRNGNYRMDEDEEETLGQVAFYYLDDMEITQEEYDRYAIGGDADYAHLCGNTLCLEFLQRLNGLTAENS